MKFSRKIFCLRVFCKKLDLWKLYTFKRYKVENRKTKSVHFCTLRNRANFTCAGTNGLRKLTNCLLLCESNPVLNCLWLLKTKFSKEVIDYCLNLELTWQSSYLDEIKIRNKFSRNLPKNKIRSNGCYQCENYRSKLLPKFDYEIKFCWTCFEVLIDFLMFNKPKTRSLRFKQLSLMLFSQLLI